MTKNRNHKDFCKSLLQLIEKLGKTSVLITLQISSGFRVKTFATRTKNQHLSLRVKLCINYYRSTKSESERYDDVF